MCFYTGDCDWCAEIEEVDERPSDKDRHCHECHYPINAGEMTQHIFQQESEECVACENGDCDCLGDDGNGDCCKCDPPDYGEIFECWHCLNCAKFLKAVKSAEIKAGCHETEAVPLLGEMVESIMNAGKEEARKYFKEALTVAPELKTNGYLGRLWKRMFV